MVEEKKRKRKSKEKRREKERKFGIKNQVKRDREKVIRVRRKTNRGVIWKRGEIKRRVGAPNKNKFF